MVISLDKEIEPYQPYGRSVINLIPNPKLVEKKKKSNKKIINNNLEDFLEDDADETTILSTTTTTTNQFNNDFITAELDLTRDLFRSIDDVPINDSKKFNSSDFWKLKKTSKGEEELYVNGNSIVYSHKSSKNPEKSFFDKSYTFDENIIDAVWCNFTIHDNTSAVVKTFANEYKIDPKSTKNGKKVPKIIKTLCILDRYSIHIVSENGDYYRKLLPFRISRIIATNHGLLFERAEFDNKTVEYPTIFLLSNPLNDLHEVVLIGLKPNQINHLKFIDIIQEKNLAIFYCSKTKSHCIFYLRSATQCDLNFYQTSTTAAAAKTSETFVGENRNSDFNSSFNANQLLSTPTSNNEQLKKQQFSGLTSSISRNTNSNLLNMIQQGSSSTHRNSSPLTSITTVVLNSPLNSRHSLSNNNNEMNLKTVLSPSVSNLISSRMDSPVSPNLNRFQFSNSNRLNDIDLEVPPHLDSHDSLNVNLSKTIRSFKTPNTSFHSPTPSSSLMMRTFDSFSIKQQSDLEINVDFVLEFIWSETAPSTTTATTTSSSSLICADSIASKIFISNDFLGQNYLCLLTKNNGILSRKVNSFLKLIRFDQVSSSEDKSKRPQYVFFNTKVLNIKDAEPLPSLNMIIVLDENNTLILYSGFYKVAIVHLKPEASLLNQTTTYHKTSSFLTPNLLPTKSNFKSNVLNQSFDEEFFNWSPEISQLQKNKIHHASSPIDNNVYHSMDETEDKIPTGEFSFSIQQYPSFGEIIKLKDSIDNRVTIETDNSNLYRLSFPSMASTFLVDKCIAGLRQTLPKDVIFHFFSNWYTYRNSTNREEIIPEIILLKLCLFSSIGFDKESIKKYYLAKNEIKSCSSNINKNTNHCSTATNLNNNHSFEQNESVKKIKIDLEEDQGCDEDFYKLLIDNDIQISNENRKKFVEKILLKSENSSCPGFLYQYVPHILYSMHLIYEDLKLIQMNWPQCKNIVDILYMLSINLQLPQYQDYYYRDFWQICNEVYNGIDESFALNKEQIIYPSYFTLKPFSIFESLYFLIDNNKNNTQTSTTSFPYIGCGGNVIACSKAQDRSIVTPNIFNLILLYANLQQQEFIHPQLILQHIGNNLHCDSNTMAFFNVVKFEQITMLFSDSENNSEKRDPKEKILFLMSALGINLEYIKQLTFGTALPLWNTIFYFRMNPKNDWCSSIYSLIDRQDLLALELQSSSLMNKFSQFTNNQDNEYSENNFTEELDYLDSSVLRLLFPNDQRLHEAYRMLISYKPVVINIKQEDDIPDNEFVEEQEKHLLAHSYRTMALPLGRGMITLRSFNPIVVERFPIPPLVLLGKVPPRQIIHLNHIDLPPNMNVWPLFHNGVAAGLRISSSPNRMVDSSWILFNKPSNCSSADDHYEHAGFLLALGLNGLLDNLSIMDLHDYLSKGNDLTKVAILLGLAASRRGTMDSTAYVLLGIHLEGLLPSMSTELDVSPIVKVAAVLGTGLLFQGTGHRYISEVMLNEIGRPPGPEMDHYIDRESYALSAGLAFGLVTLARGNELMNMMTSDGVSIPDQLNHYMLGVHKKISALQKEKTKTPSYHIREGDCINADVTSPGATLALGMMFFNTENKAIAQWLDVPETQKLLEMVRPDFLLLRVLAKNLIMWSEIQPSAKWIDSHIPSIIYNNAFQRNNGKETKLENEMLFLDDIDYETMTQSYCNIIAGACFALALKYAGSANKEAFQVVYQYTLKLIIISQKGQSFEIEQAGKSTIESCVNILIVSCAIIMAGTGNLEIMRICRYLRSRIRQPHVLYGSFMAIHMALGLLFLGGCKMTLNSSAESVAALICAFFPKYPIHANDNRYHLQAFRHLYVLACEPRLLIPSCIDTGLPLYAKIKLTYKNPGMIDEEKTAPCFLPDLNHLEKLELIDDNYWTISFQSDTNFDKLLNCLKLDGKLFIKRKIKALSYNKKQSYDTNEDGNNNFLKLNEFPTDNKKDQKSFSLFDFTNEVILKTFSEVFDNSNCNDQELSMKNTISSILYDCAENETLDLFVPLIQLISTCSKMFPTNKNKNKIQINDNNQEDPSFKYFIIWQIKLSSHYLNIMQLSHESNYQIIETIKFQIESIIKKSIDKIKLRKYLQKQITIKECNENTIDAIVFYNLPFEKIEYINENDNNDKKDLKFLNLIKLLRSKTKCLNSTFFLSEIFR